MGHVPSALLTLDLLFFFSMEQLGVLPLPPGWDVFPSQGVRVPKNEATRSITTPSWMERYSITGCQGTQK